MLQHAMCCFSNFPNYAMENFWKNDFFEWDMGNLLKNIQRKDNLGRVVTPTIT
jgi:hypothetical protein